MYLWPMMSVLLIPPPAAILPTLTFGLCAADRAADGPLFETPTGS